MKNYILEFTANGARVSKVLTADITFGITSLNYKPIVDEEISKWLVANQLNATSTKILDIVLLNESSQQVFNQEDWSEYTTIIIKKYDEKSNSDLIGIKINKDEI